MYTSFSALPQSGVAASTRLSCLPCRRKKKKCDGVQPRCSRCRDSYGRDECIWSVASDSTAPKTSKTRNVEERSGATDSSMSSGLSIPSELQNALPSLSPDKILQAVEAFEKKVLCSHPSYKQSIFTLSLPLAVQHEPLLHAWISAILVAIPDDSNEGHQRSVMYYDRAVRGLKSAILSERPYDEWKRATALLCHAIELLQPVQSPKLARAHLQGAHYMFQSARSSSYLPDSEHDSLLFEAYIMRTATNCLLQQDIHLGLPFEYIRQLSSMHQRALDRLDLKLSTQNCPWLGAPGLDLIDSVYKVSWLNAHTPLSDALLQEVVKVWEFLVSVDEQSTPSSGSPQEEEDKAVKCVYRSACQVIARPLLPDHYPVAMDNEVVANMGIRCLDVITRSSCDDVSLQWPLIVLGAIAATQSDQRLCSTIAARFMPKAPQQAVDNILSFWHVARQIEDKRLCFRDSELLRSILL